MPAAFSGSKGNSLNVRCIGRWPFGSAYAVVVQSDYAYLSSGGGIYILDISNPTSTNKVGGIATLGIVEGLLLDNSLLYVADGDAGLRVIDVSDPANPEEVGYYDTPDDAEGVWVSGSYA